jgi:hypothetical protein
MLALLIIPAGVLVWVGLWSLGFITSIVAFGIAVGAVWLYRKGSGGLITREGAWTVTAIVVVTLLIAFWLGLVLDEAGGIKHLDRLSNPVFWRYFSEDFGALVKQDILSLLIAVAFAALGVRRVLGNAFATARATAETASNLGAESISPDAESAQSPDEKSTRD